MRSIHLGCAGLPSFSRLLLCAFFTTALPAATVDFKAQIQPVLNASCVPCHQAAKANGGLALDSPEALAQGGKSGAVVTAGDSSRSLLYQRISATDKSVRMPLGGTALPAETIALIRTWIEQGAPGVASKKAGEIEYDRDVRPILEANCYSCHSGEQAKSQLRLDRKATALKGGMSGPVILPGDSQHSRLVHRVSGMDGEPRMPFGRKPLAQEQIAMLSRWIDQGAKWPDSTVAADAGVAKHWAYIQPVRPAIPPVRKKGWVRNLID